MRTVAPKERGGRLLRNWARTTPELPVLCIRHGPLVGRLCASNHTVWPGDLAPDDSDLGAADLLRGAVDEGNLLSEVEAVLLISHAGLRLPNSIPPHLAALGSSTPSILIKLVPGLVLRLPLW